ncbi:MAG: glycosyltransferase [Gemmatimonadetes bacterium]|nr:glycosyltransferase [Gemmatimonadota bacterium]
MNLSVIVSTYESPDWLEHVLRGYALQTHRDFEIVVADDGSGPDTRTRLERLREETGLAIRHVWQEDEGYRRSRVLNAATLAAEADYLVFTDGDCIPRRDFLSAHARRAKPGRFLSGGAYRLNEAASHAVTREDIETGRAFDLRWLEGHGMPRRDRAALKLAARPPWSGWLDRLTTTRATWNCGNSSAWKSDIVAVNGFDERMQYGGADRELGERLWNLGLKSRHVRYTAVCVHLEHRRAYATAESWRRNDAIRRESRTSRRSWTEDGMVKGSRPA